MTLPAPLQDLRLAPLAAAYAAGSTSPSALITALHPALEALSNAFIVLVPLDALLQRARELEGIRPEARGQLWGVPFAVKDNVDAAGLPTTAACPSFQYTPSASAPAVDALLAAGGIMVGKTNMDQFASGLVGTRSPYGVAPNAFDDRFIPGGSSSGSGAAVGAGLVTFALGTDTAGSGRVPAGYNGCVGIKPTVGSISTVGVVPACAALDCLSVFACSVQDAATVAKIMRSADAGAADVWRRTPLAPAPQPGPAFRFGVPTAAYLEWGGTGGAAMAQASAAQFAAATQRLQEAGGQLVQDFDFGPFAATAALLYQSSFIAERYSGIRAFLDKVAGKGEGMAPEAALEQQRRLVGDERLLLVTRAIISGAGNFTATDVFDDRARMAVLAAQARVQLAKVDLLLVPTVLEHYLVEEVQAEETAPVPTWPKNAKNGRFTNFVNLLDMCGISIPQGLLAVDYSTAAAGVAGESEAANGVHAAAGAAGDTGGTADSAAGAAADGAAAVRAARLAASGGPLAVTLPFGVTLLARSWSDEWLWGVAEKLHATAGVGCGPEGHGVVPVHTKQ